MIYVCSDIHGCANRFYKLLKEIDFKDSDHLYILGDIIDRNPDGVELLKYVMDKPNITLLMGNHEHFMYSYLVRLNVLGKLDIKDNFPSDIWLSSNNGGMVTLNSFAEESLAVKNDILKYLSTLPVIILLTVNGRKYHLSHAGTFANVLDKDVWYVSDFPKHILEDVVWSCPYRADTYICSLEYPDDCISIMGHVPVQKLYSNFSDFPGIFRRPDKDYAILHDDGIVNIDSGCAMRHIESNWGVETALSCICLNNLKEYYVK